VPQQDPDTRTEADQKQVEKRAAISVHVVHAAIYQEGLDELRRTPSALAWSALAAGMSMGFSLLAEALLYAYLPDVPWRPLISKTGYSVGFLIVILGRQQLFTENTLVVVLPTLQHRDRHTLLAMLRLWGIVFTANILGTAIFAVLVGKALQFPDSVSAALSQVTADSVPLSFGLGFVRAVFAGWLIALTIWLLPGAASARVTIIFILTYIIGLGGFHHVIADR
jgi:formate/nitrite transporter FocA (FNT family)